MSCRIAHKNIQRIAPVIAEEECRHHKEQPCNPCGNEVQHIVYTRRHTSEVKIACVLIAKHGIHRIRRTIEYGKRRTAKCEEKEWCNHAVHSVLCDGFDCCTRSIRLIELCGITPDDITDMLPRCGEISLDQQCIDVLPRLCEHTRRDTEVEENGTDHIRPPCHRQRPCCQEHPLSKRIGNAEHKQSQKRSHGKFLCIAPVRRIEYFLQKCNETTKDGDGMPPRLRITEHGIKKKCRHGDERGRDHLRPSTISRSFSMSRLARTVSARRS